MSKITEAKLRFIAAGVVMVFTVIALFTINGTMAWFANNDAVDSDGMQVSVKSFSNLIIAKNEEDILAGKLQFDVSFGESSRSDMIPVTHDDAAGQTYLKYLTNHYVIDRVTGVAKNEQALEFEPVPTEDNGQYFVDCTVLLASVSAPIEVSSLMANISAVDDRYLNFPHMHALSVDFYVEEVSVDGYRGTVSLAEGVSGSYEGVNLFGDGGGEVPLNTDGYITVIMRFYFDGALLDDNGNAYINTDTVKQDDVVIAVTFTAKDKTDN